MAALQGRTIPLAAVARGMLAGAMGTAAMTAWQELAARLQLVPTGLYEPPWKCPPKERPLDLSYHLVYGDAVVAAYRALEP